MSNEFITVEEWLRSQRPGSPRRNKFGVSDPSKRRAFGRTYGSMLEMEFAGHLRLLCVTGDVVLFIEQPRRTWNDGDNIYIPDFFVLYADSRGALFIDTKGMQTPKFKRDKRLWSKHERLDLQLIGRHGRNGFGVLETIKGRG